VDSRVRLRPAAEVVGEARGRDVEEWAVSGDMGPPLARVGEVFEVPLEVVVEVEPSRG